MSIEKTVWDYFKGKNVPDITIASIMGNIYAESGFDPDAIESGNGIGLGLCQWSFGRRTQLEAFGTTLPNQLDFLWSELTGQNTEVTGANYQWIDKEAYLTNEIFMQGSGTIPQLVSAFCFCWERPAEEYAHLDVRIEWANKYYTDFNGSPVDPVDPVDPNTGDYKIKNKNIYGFGDSLFGRKFTSTSTSFKLLLHIGDMAIVTDKGKKICVPFKNLTKI